MPTVVRRFTKSSLPRRGWRVVLAGSLVLALGSLGVPQAMADTYGITTTIGNGSLDFSSGGWRPASSASSGSQLGSFSFSLGVIPNAVTVRVPAASNSPLFANTVRVNTNGHTYSYDLGDSSTSHLLVQGPSDTQSSEITITSRNYFINSSQTNSLGFAWEGNLSLPGGTSLLASEVLDVTENGELIHYLTLTNTSSVDITGLYLYALLDTMLDSNDYIPIIKAAADSACIENAAIQLCLDNIGAGVLLVGSWSNTPNLRTYVDVANAGTAVGGTLVSGQDTAAAFGLTNQDILAGESVTMIWQERLTEIQAVRVVYVDDATGQPVAAATRTGRSLTPIGFTEAMARAGVPAGYSFVRIDNVDDYDNDIDAGQTITVHVAKLPPLPATGGDQSTMALWAAGGLMFLLAGALFLSRRSLQIAA